MKRCTKAIIPVAGYGTRRLPITKAIEKCMLPVCNRPIVDYVVEECVMAGIADIYFVVSNDFEQLRSYYSANVELERYLVQRGKQAEFEAIQKLPQQANFHYIVQDLASAKAAYGTAVPVWIARDAIKNDEHFAVLMGDDFIFHPQGNGQDLSAMQDAMAASGANSAIVGVEMDEQKIELYGSMKVTQDGEYEYFEGIVEKPKPGQAPSNMINISNYIFDHKILDYVYQVMQEPNEHGEHFLTDAVNLYAEAGNKMVAIRSNGMLLDGGNLDGWIDANNIVYKYLKNKSQ